MTAVLYYSRNPNPRLAVAVARHLAAPVTLVWCAPFDPAQAEFFKALNPSQRIPILVEDGKSLWEADAIACRLSQMTGSDLWRSGIDQPDMIRWLSWGKQNFVLACDMVHFELGTKQRYRIGPIDTEKLDEGHALFDEAACLLDAHMKGRDWLVGTTPSYADFRMASFLPFNDVAGLPLSGFPNVRAWAERLGTLPFWNEPFAGLESAMLPALPEAPTLC
jgi:glutathione S-transferase